MIYTLTLNTSLDYVIHIDELKTGEINKSSKYQMYPGGKGINVSQVLKEFGIESTAMGFVAGHTGECLEAMLEERNIHTDFVYLNEGMTRVNVKIRSGESIQKQPVETDINLSGPVVAKEEVEVLLSRLASVGKDDFVVISGSVPPSITVEDYVKIIRTVTSKGAAVIVDAAGDYLKAAIECHPFLIKPNRDELEEILNMRADDDNIEEMARMLIEKGAQNVLVSLGDKGGILCTCAGETIRMNAPRGKTVNTVGAGDSMVAGFVAGMFEKSDYAYAMKMAIGAGSATAFGEGLATFSDIKAVIECL